MITSKHKWHLIPLTTAGLGLAALGTGIGLALTGHELALLPVGISNLAMVLSILGSTVFIASAFLFYWQTFEDAVNLKWQNDAGRYQFTPMGFCALGAVIAFAASVIGTAIVYGGMHWGVGPLLTNALGVEASLGLQAGLGFAATGTFSCAVMMLILVIESKEGEIHKNWSEYKGIIGFLALGSGALGAVATVAGSALTHAMGVAAANSVEAIVLESTIGMSIFALFGMLKNCGMYLWHRDYL